MPSLTIRIADAMRVSGYIESDKDNRAKSAKARIVQALARVANTPMEKPTVPMESVNASIWLSAAECDQLSRYGAKFLLTEGEAASALLIADFERWQQEQAAETAKKAIAQSERGVIKLRTRLVRAGITPRREQERLYESFEALDGGTDRRVLVAESGTGTGKTLAFLSLALDWIEDNRLARVYVATPTLALMAQTRKELASLLDTPSTPKPTRKTVKKDAPTTDEKQSPPPDVQVAYMSGQSEWVSEIALTELLNVASEDHRLNEQEIAQIHELMAQWTRNPAYNPDLPPWSTAALEKAIPGFAWIDDITLRSENASTSNASNDAGVKAYQSQFTRLASAQLIVMTHAMLSHLIKRRYYSDLHATKGNLDIQAAAKMWSDTPATLRDSKLYEVLNSVMGEHTNDSGKQLLPDADLLIIDEAHAFRDAFSSAFETYISLNTALRSARALNANHSAALPRDSTNALIDVVAEMQRMEPPEESDSAMDLQNSPDLMLRLADALQLAIEPKSSASKKKIAEIRSSKDGRLLLSLARSVRIFAEGVAKSKSIKAFLHWSPRREFPRLTMGSQYLNRELNYIWTHVAQRTLLISGTMYEEIPLPSCEGMRQSLSVPMEALRTMQPIHADWQIEPVTLYSVVDVKDFDGRTRFCRPKSKDRRKDGGDANHQGWLDDVSQYIGRVQKTAKGGVLVVGTAFEDLEGIASRLCEHPPLGPLLVHRKGEALAGLRVAFLEQSKTARVTLLASGAAWTGFDLYDPANPDALTDLVILQTPFGLASKSVTNMIQQMDDRGHFVASRHALTLVRQVVGRLIRSPNTPHNRRIHWLDARVHNPEWRGLTASIRRFLSRYKQVTVS